MLIGLIVLLSVGLLALCLGLLIWKKQKISLIHDYHTGRLRREDLPAYARLMGLGLTAIGAGCIVTAVIALALEQPLGWIALPAGLVLGLGLIVRAQKRYNGGIFSG